MGMVRRVTDAQVKELRLRLHQGASLKMAAMKVDMDRKSARKYREPGPLPSAARPRATGGRGRIRWRRSGHNWRRC